MEFPSQMVSPRNELKSHWKQLLMAKLAPFGTQAIEQHRLDYESRETEDDKL